MENAGAATFNSAVTIANNAALFLTNGYIQINNSSYDNIQLGVDSGGYFVYNAQDSAYQMRISNDGEASIRNGLTLTNGNLVVANGHGIDFSAQTGTATGSTTSELLDHYEEGSFAPTIATPSSSVSYTQQFGHYVKVGRLVTFNMAININVVTSVGSGTFEMAGLPFASSSSNINNTRFVCQTSGVDFNSDYYSFYAFTPTTGVSTLRIIYTNDNGTWSVATESNFAIGNSDIIVITGQYYTD